MNRFSLFFCMACAFIFYAIDAYPDEAPQRELAVYEVDPTLLQKSYELLKKNLNQFVDLMEQAQISTAATEFHALQESISLNPQNSTAQNFQTLVGLRSQFRALAIALGVGEKLIEAQLLTQEILNDAFNSIPPEVTGKVQWVAPSRTSLKVKRRAWYPANQLAGMGIAIGLSAIMNYLYCIYHIGGWEWIASPHGVREPVASMKMGALIPAALFIMAGLVVVRATAKGSTPKGKGVTAKGLATSAVVYWGVAECAKYLVVVAAHGGAGL
jgi:hypothetical protein